MTTATRLRPTTLVCAMVRPEKPVKVITMPESDNITCVRSASTENCDCTMSNPFAGSRAPAARAIGGVLRLRLMTRELTDDPALTLVRMLDLRERKARLLGAALLLFVIGFSCYDVAIASMLVATQPS